MLRTKHPGRAANARTAACVTVVALKSLASVSTVFVLLRQCSVPSFLPGQPRFRSAIPRAGWMRKSMLAEELEEDEAEDTPLQKHQKSIDLEIRRFWAGRGGYDIAESERQRIAHAGPGEDEVGREADGPESYGEATPVGVRQLGDILGISGEGFVIGRNLKFDGPVYFMDLGCGLGRLIAQAYVEWPNVQRAVGVELSKTRIEHAKGAWRDLVASGDADRLRSIAVELSEDALPPALPTAAEAVSFIEGDIFKEDISNATHIYLSSRCFPQSMMGGLAELLASKADRLHIVATLRPFPDGLDGFEHLGHKGVEMTWTKYRAGGDATHVYIRSQD